ncbi:MAG: hypothetical protein RLZZ591_1716 [Pseudomonadota bacterium]|jgi:carbon-monoxide dehydrogenase large subunit
MALNPQATSATSRFGSGQAVRRLEDDTLLQGLGQFTDDVTVPDLAYLAFVRSPYPHAQIQSIDTSRAATMPGVLQVLTGADLVAAGVKPLPGVSGYKRADRSPAATSPRHALAVGRVRFVGEPVVAVVAATLQQARDAAEAVVIDFDELPMVVHPALAVQPGAPVLCEQAPDNICAQTHYGDTAACDAAFAKAAHVVQLQITNQRVVALSLEPRSALATWDADTQRMTVRMSTQTPSGVRDTLCGALGMPASAMRILVGDVGGGFGMKTGAYPEDLALAYCCRTLRRNVKWVAERSEEFVATTHGRDVLTQAALALDAQGKALGLRIDTLANVGAYGTGGGVAIQVEIGPWVQTSVYDIQTIDFSYKAVLTNTAPTGPYRGAGRPEAIFIIERLWDEAARQTGIDRLSLRRRNFIQPAQLPYKNPMGHTYDSGNFEAILDQGLALADWAGFEQRAAATAVRGLLRGQGVATFLEWTGANVLQERVTVSVQASGVIEVFSAVNAMGQGIATSLAQLVVDAFGVPMHQVRVVLGDTDRGDGFGSAGSRSIFVGGSAVQVGSERTLDKARQLAAAELEVAEQDLIYEQGQFKVPGTDVALGLFELAGRQADQRIFIESTSKVQAPSWPNGCHMCEVEIDPATGSVAVVAYASVNDVGRVVNPMIVRGQLEGGAVQGLGQALCEHMIYDPHTGQPVTGSLMDYAAPRADAFPEFKTETNESTPCLTNPLGVKGVGELGTIGATPALVNAVADALARAGLAHLAPRLQMPLSPARVWELMKAGV